MRISVVTVSLNAGKTIGDALQSVADQTLPDVEHIIVDGGSTDDTLAIVRQFPHVAKIISEKDDGLYDAMNKGWRAASGDLIGWLNADDMLAGPDALATIASLADPSVPVIAGSIEMVDAASPDRVLRRYSAADFDLSWLKYAYAPPHPGLYIQRDLLDTLGGYDLRYPLTADFDLISRALYREKLPFRTTADVIARMRVGGRSSGLKATIAMYNEMHASCLRNGIPTNRAMLLTKYFRKALQYVR